MQTEFTCGICRTVWPSSSMQWMLKVNNVSFGFINEKGTSIYFTAQHLINTETLMEIAVLMNNIKRQNKQLQTT